MNREIEVVKCTQPLVCLLKPAQVGIHIIITPKYCAILAIK